jgi:energy-converting hydrogenase Eha subunit C
MSEIANEHASKIGGRLERQRQSGLLSLCCALSVVTIVVMVPPLSKIVRGLLLDGPRLIVVAAACLLLVALLGSLYFFLAVVLHLTRSEMGAAGKTIWGVFLLFGGTLTAVVYFLMVWSVEERS